MAPVGAFKKPTLPERGSPWHAMTQAFWSDLMASEMAPEYVSVDLHGLYILADLVDDYWCGDKDRATEIRLQGQRYGLSPLDRRRLQWTVGGEKGTREEAQQESAEQPTKAADPRNILDMTTRLAKKR